MYFNRYYYSIFYAEINVFRPVHLILLIHLFPRVIFSHRFFFLLISRLDWISKEKRSFLLTAWYFLYNVMYNNTETCRLHCTLNTCVGFQCQTFVPSFFFVLNWKRDLFQQNLLEWIIWILQSEYYIWLL